MMMNRELTVTRRAAGGRPLIAAAVFGAGLALAPAWAGDQPAGGAGDAAQQADDGGFVPAVSGAPTKRVGAGSRRLGPTHAEPCPPGDAADPAAESATPADAAEASAAAAGCEGPDAPSR